MAPVNKCNSEHIVIGAVRKRASAQSGLVCSIGTATVNASNVMVSGYRTFTHFLFFVSYLIIDNMKSRKRVTAEKAEWMNDWNVKSGSDE